MRRRFWLGIAAVTLVALGSVLAAGVVYFDERDDFRQMQREEAMRAAHQMEAVAELSVDQLITAAAFFRFFTFLSPPWRLPRRSPQHALENGGDPRRMRHPGDIPTTV